MASGSGLWGTGGTVVNGPGFGRWAELVGRLMLNASAVELAVDHWLASRRQLGEPPRVIRRLGLAAHRVRLLRESLDAPALQAAGTTLDEVGGLLTVRNTIAHGPLVLLYADGATPETSVPVAIFVADAKTTDNGGGTTIREDGLMFAVDAALRLYRELDTLRAQFP
jgi:hypothetical protein